MCSEKIRLPGKGTVITIIWFYIVGIKVTNINLEQDFILVNILGTKIRFWICKWKHL